jgi:hypothetical protein
MFKRIMSIAMAAGLMLVLAAPVDAQGSFSAGYSRWGSDSFSIGFSGPVYYGHHHSYPVYYSHPYSYSYPAHYYDRSYYPVRYYSRYSYPVYYTRRYPSYARTYYYR